MKTITQINSLLVNFHAKYGYKIEGHQQQSEAWTIAKLGVLSASSAHAIVAKKDTGTRDSYMNELAAQVLTGKSKQISAEALDYGNQHEDAARACYELKKKCDVTRLPFVFKDDLYREGCSPDGLISDIRGLEIKCPFNAANFVEFFCDDSFDSKWKWQAQYVMRILECDLFDFSEFLPDTIRGHLIKTLPIERDLKKQKVFDEAAPEFIFDLDKKLEKLELKFGDQWRWHAKKQAAELASQEPAQEFKSEHWRENQ